MCDDRRTTDTDRKTILADSGRRLADALRGGGADQFTVVLPGAEPLEFRVFVCRGAEEAAACLHRHGWGREGRTTQRDRDILAEYGRRIQEEFLRAGRDPVRVVLPGAEPLEFRVFLCKDAEEAAACLQRHGWGIEGRNPVTELDPRRAASLRARDEAFGRSNGTCQLCGAASRPATRR